jgi:CheY-like chemotaxis protein
MIPAGDRGAARDLALRLVGALAPVLADEAAAGAVAAARGTARELGLGGLERILAACAAHAGRAWPAELAPALARVRRLAARAFEEGELDPFRLADHELAGLADELAALQWSPAWRADSDAAHPVATLSLADTLDDLPLADDAARDLARRARLVPPVAAALRAALDWLVGDTGRPLALRAEDSLLEVLCERIDFAALGPATEVLAAAGGNLGPGPGPVGTWMVRVPLHTGRDAYLMLVHGGVPIAIPWHAVLRLHMVAAAEVVEDRSLGGWPVVRGPLGGDLPRRGEVPLALVAHGRKRGWIVADRLVWRLPAEPATPTERAPAEGLTTLVQTEEGEGFWLADPGWLLRSIEAPSLVRMEPRATPEPAPAPPREEAAPPEPAPAPPREEAAPPEPVRAPPREEAAPPERAQLRDEVVPPAPIVTPSARPVPELRLLTSADAEPLGAEPVAPGTVPPRSGARVSSPAAPERGADLAPEAPAREGRSLPGAGATPAPGSPPAPVPRLPRTALVAEDSITARIFLARLLGRLGFDVRAVDTAAALRSELERGSWSIVCVDIELPDEAGAAFLAGLVARHGARAPFVALVRDARDRAAAHRAGIEPMLRKPFDERELGQVLGRLGFLPRKPQ